MVTAFRFNTSAILMQIVKTKATRMFLCVKVMFETPCNAVFVTAHNTDSNWFKIDDSKITFNLFLKVATAQLNLPAILESAFP